MTEELAPVVQAVGLGKTFRDFWNRPKAKAVDDIDFEIRPGEIVGLLGPNGSGKSTTVKMLLGLLYPSTGKLSVLGRSPRAVETKRMIGYLPEESYLYKYLTAEETLDFFGSLFNLSKAERRRRIDQLLDMVGLAHARKRRVGEFSKGMARRIGLAQAMINDPEFLILDEPTSGLDPLGSKEVKDLILTLKKRGKTVLMTSHLLSDVEDVCDRIFILYGGRIRAAGSIDELLEVSDSARITVPRLEGDAMRNLLDTLRRELKGENFTVDHPRKSLEDFFLDVVEQARRQALATSGVSGSGGIAEYLSEPEGSDARIEALLKAEETPDLPKEEEPSPEAVRRDQEVRLEAKIDSLVKDDEAPAKPTRDQLEAEAKRREMDEASEKLKDLL